MKLRPEQILPSQNFLKPDTIAFILECYSKNTVKLLPPSPIVREDGVGNFIAIDGHNLIAIKLVRSEYIDVHLAAHAEDGLPLTNEANMARNQDLLERFDSVLLDRERLKLEGINSFEDLISRYTELFHN